MSQLQYLNDTNFEETIKNSDVPVVVDFYADWCAPCRIIAPIVEEVASDYNGRAKVAKFNVDQSMFVAQSLGIRSIPTVIFFKNGAEADRLIGVAQKEELGRRLDNLL